ncbi:hypothetical protein [Kitasatospora sp. NPDC089509]|uniref:hypothetical protein n=1 Tax=Kitasatospora sp. NPDC089509 TaxID=3364079 RepID=UPI003819C9C6
MIRQFIRLAFAGTVAAVVLTASGCENPKRDEAKQNDAANSGSIQHEGDSMPDMSTSGSPGAGSGGLKVNNKNDQVEDFLTDALGNSLYVFNKDTADPPKSNCSGDCAQTWRPLPPADATQQWPGVTGKVGVVTRDDKSQQLTIGGHPVYTYVRDTVPGEINGNGVNGAWSLAAPDGTKAAKRGSGGKDQGGKDSKGGEQNRQNDGGKQRDNGREQVNRRGADANLTVVVVPVVGEVLSLNQRVIFLNGDGIRLGGQRGCRSDCLRQWRPLKRSDLGSVDRTKVNVQVGEVTNEDGSVQLTINGQRAFTFVGAQGPNDTSGMGDHGCWWPFSAGGGAARPPQGK